LILHRQTLTAFGLFGGALLTGAAIARVPFLAPPVLLFISFVLLALGLLNPRLSALLRSLGFFTGSEVAVRMTAGSLLPWEFSKYACILLLAVALLRRSRREATPWSLSLFLLFLFPSMVLLPWEDLQELRRQLSFNLSGPVLMGLGLLVFYRRRVTFEEMKGFFLWTLVGVLLMVGTILIRSPSLAEIEFADSANFAASGGYGPNQVSTLYGLGLLLLGGTLLLPVFRLLGKWSTWSLFFSLLFLATLTFSRGGLFAALLGISATLMVTPARTGGRQRIFLLFVFLVTATVVFVAVNQLSEGQARARYLNIDEHNQFEREDYTTGRLDIMKGDLRLFLDHPILGVGPGNSAWQRQNIQIVAHSEMTRLLAEHGLFGLMILLAMFFLPLRAFANPVGCNRPFLVMVAGYALLTMLHSATRLAVAPLLFALGFVLLAQPTPNLALPPSLKKTGP
jgi:O-antigen ligase